MEPWQVLEALERKDGEIPMRFRVRLIKSGISKNGNEYPMHVLREAAPLFNGARVRAVSDEFHLSGKKGSVRDLVAGISDVSVDKEGLVGTVTVSEAEKWLAVKLNDALNGIPGFFGFSLVAEARGKLARLAGRVIRKVNRITNVKFVDAVVDPSAGGEILGLAEAITETEDEAMREQLLKLLESKAPALYAKIDVEKISDDELVTMVAEAVQDNPDPDDKKPADAAGGDDRINVGEAVRAELKPILETFQKELREGFLEEKAKENATRMFNVLFAESKLPDDAKTSVKARIEEGKEGDEDAIREAIKAERKYLAEATGWNGRARSFARLDMGADSRDKKVAGLQGFFLGEAQRIGGGDNARTIDPFISIKEAYRQITGDVDCTGRIEDAVNLSEAEIASGSWAELLRDAMHVALQREYKMTGLDQWRAVADVVPVADFRTNYRPQMGGFSDLASVSESAAYAAFASEPSDDEASYSVTKYGRTQAVTLETIVNDDVGAIQRLPRKMARAAMRTVSVQAWAPVINNSNIYDGTALFAAGHGSNLGSTALSATTLAAGRMAMRKQAEPDSSERLLLNPRWLIVPVDLEQTAFELCYTPNKPLLGLTDTNAALGTATTGTAENPGIPNFHQTFNLEPLVIPHMTDANNWYMAADKGDVPLIEVGFLGGRQTPELFVQDLPSQGSMFTEDVITYKIRLIFGVAVLDYRGWYGAVVA